MMTKRDSERGKGQEGYVYESFFFVFPKKNNKKPNFEDDIVHVEEW